MRKAKLQAATLGGNPDDVEAAFYDALRQGDIERLMACWADEEEIVCVHPNGTVQAHPTNVHKVDSLASAMHHLVERVEVLGSDGPQTAYVLTTNVYHKTPQGWRMVAHHASPGTPNAPAEVSSSPSVLH
jgi:ketosteroid isomerase-like protein